MFAKAASTLKLGSTMIIIKYNYIKTLLVKLSKFAFI